MNIENIKPRQNQVLHMILNGHNINDIAAELKVSRKTIEFHIYGFMREHDLHSLYELVEWAIENNFVKTPKIDIEKLKLTKQQIAVLKFTGEGLNTKEIADVMQRAKPDDEKSNVSTKSVEYHRSKVMKKFGLKNMAQYIRLAFSVYDSVKNTSISDTDVKLNYHDLMP